MKLLKRIWNAIRSFMNDFYGDAEIWDVESYFGLDRDVEGR